MFAATATFASATSVIVPCSTLAGPTELNGNVVCNQLSLASLPMNSTVSDIIITLSGSINGTLSIQNLDSSAHTGKATTTSAFNLSAAMAGFSFPLNGSGDLIDASFTTGLQTVAGNTTFNSPSLFSGVVTSTATDSAAFGAYEGSGTFNIPVFTLTSLNSTFGGGNVKIGQVTNGSATATVQYDYTVQSATPEPVTMLLFGSGLLGLGLLRKRVKS